MGATVRVLVAVDADHQYCWRPEVLSGVSCFAARRLRTLPGLLGGSTEMINDGRSNAHRKVLVKCIDQNLLPSAQPWGHWRPGPPIAAPGTGHGHIDLLCYLGPGRSLVTQLKDLLRGSWMSRDAQ
jgi:hypothetical protein